MFASSLGLSFQRSNNKSATDPQALSSIVAVYFLLLQQEPSPSPRRGFPDADPRVRLLLTNH